MNLLGSIKGHKPSRAFTRVDLAVLVSIIFLGAAFANPLFTSQARQRADVLVCQDNLRQVGRAFQIWATDHELLNPWLVSYEQGGLRGYALAGNAYIQFAWVSNGMSSPKVLVCPADTNVTRRATNFSNDANGGLMHPGYRNNALSYMLNFHAQYHLPRSILCGDRNIDNTQVSSCSLSGGIPTRAINGDWRGGLITPWGDGIHWRQGNLLFSDGSVTLADDQLLLNSVIVTQDDAVVRAHVLFPRAP